MLLSFMMSCDSIDVIGTTLHGIEPLLVVEQI